MVAENIRVVCRGCRITFDNKLLFFGSGVSQLGPSQFLFFMSSGIEFHSLDESHKKLD